MGFTDFFKDLLPDGFVPDECTPFKYNPMSWQLEQFIKLNKGKLNIHDRESCKSKGAQILNDFQLGNLASNLMVKCACDRVFDASNSHSTAWAPWLNLGGPIKGQVGAVIFYGGTDLFVRGMDDFLWQKYCVDAKWSNWTQPDTSLKLASSPSAVSFNKHHRSVFATGVDGQVYHRYFYDKPFPWQCLGGKIQGDVASVSMAKDVIDLYVRGMDDFLWQNYSINGNWSGWNQVDNSLKLASSPTVVSAGLSHRAVYATGQNGHVYQNQFLTDHWTGWEDLGAVIKGSASGIVLPGSFTDLYVRGMDDLLWQKFFSNGHWSDWMPVPNNSIKLTSSPTVVTKWDYPYRGVYATGPNNEVYHASWS